MEAKQPGAPVARGPGGMGNEIPQTPHWFIFIRYAQIVLTLIVFVCSCVALGQVDGYIVGWGAGFALFTSIYTAIFLAATFLVPKFAPNFYFKWFCLGAEAFAVLWWLISFAGLATWANFLSIFTSSSYPGALRTAYGACAAGAAFGAFNWVSFCVTLVFYAIGCHKHRIGKTGAWNAGGVEAGHGASMGPIGVQHTGTPQPAYDPTPEPVGYGYQGQPQQYPTVPTPAPSQQYHQ